MIPGLHINTIAELIYNYGIDGFYGVAALYAVYGIAVALEGIYAIALNIPDGATGIVPAAAQNIAAKGMVGKGVYSYIMGGVYGVIIAALTLPFLFALLPLIQPFVQDYMFLILVFASSYILLSNFKVANVIAFALAGLLGMFALNSGDFIFPMFVGFFTLPMLMVKTKTIRVEREYKTKISIKVPVIASLATAIMYLIPGVATPTQIIVLAGIFASIKEDEFVTALGAINASNIVYSLMMVDIIGKARTGVAIIAQKMFETYAINHLVIAAAGGAAFLIAAWFVVKYLREAVEFFSPFNTQFMKLLLLAYLTLLVYIINGAAGVLIMGIASVIGALALLMRAKRTNLMGSIILNALKYYYR